MIRAFVILFSSLVFSKAHAEILFIDLNNAPGEIASCQSRARSNEVHVLNQKTYDQPVRKEALDAYIQYLEDQNIDIDTVVVSSHNGYGLYSDEKGQNELDLYEIENVFAAHDTFRTRRKVVVEAACYSGNAHSCIDHWTNQKAGIHAVVGYPLQAPPKTDRGGQRTIAEMCDPNRRQQALNTNGLEDICNFQQNLVYALGDKRVAVCNREGLASELYGPDQCYNYRQLMEMCDNFDRDEAMKSAFNCYFEASEDCPEPPLDKPKARSPIRKYYNQRQLWAHCPNLESEPDLSQVIRLNYFGNLKVNLARANATELADYDQRLRDLRLDQYTLGDLSQLTRKEIKDRIEGARRAIKRLQNGGGQYAHYSKSGEETDEVTDPRIVSKMAVGLHKTLIGLFPTMGSNGELSCSKFSMIEAMETRPPKSQCIISYDQASQL